MISAIYDKENDRDVIKTGERANLMRMYEDKPIYYDNWDIDIYYTEKYWDVTELESMEWTALGPVRATLMLTRKISQSLIRQNIHFYADSRRIEFETYVDWKEHFVIDCADQSVFIKLYRIIGRLKASAVRQGKRVLRLRLRHLRQGFNLRKDSAAGSSLRLMWTGRNTSIF